MWPDTLRSAPPTAAPPGARGLCPRFSTADERSWIGWHAPHLELQMQMRANRKTGAADEADLLALLDRIANLDRHVRHVGVNLDQPVRVGDRDPEAEVVRITCGRHLSTCCGDDRSPVFSQHVDAGMKVEVAAVRRFQRKRCGSELLDDLRPLDRTEQRAGHDWVGRLAGAQLP